MKLFQIPNNVATVGTISQAETTDLPVIPAPEVDSTVWPNSKEFRLYDRTIPCVSKEGLIWIPSQFLAVDDAQYWHDQITTFLMTGGPLVLATPWILGSGKKDINQEDRSSASHISGHAVDITPVWNEPDIVDPDGSMPGLAWNLTSLLGLIELNSPTLSWAVEGDHLHITDCGRADIKKPGHILCAPTLSSAYPLATIVGESAQLHPLFSQPYAFAVVDGTVRYEPIEDIDLFRDYLEGATTTKEVLK